MVRGIAFALLAGCGRIGFETTGGSDGRPSDTDTMSSDDAINTICGDGVVGGAEECDDPNPAGCSAACTLVDQGPGGAGCSVPSMLALVRVPGAALGARAIGNTSDDSDRVSTTCVGPGPDEVFAVAVPAAGNLIVTVTPVAGVDPALALRSTLGGCGSGMGEQRCVSVNGTGSVETMTVSVTAATWGIIVETPPGLDGTYALDVTVAP